MNAKIKVCPSKNLICDVNPEKIKNGKEKRGRDCLASGLLYVFVHCQVLVT